MLTQKRYNLRNASDFLDQIRDKYILKESSQNPYDNTFIDEVDQLSNANQNSPNSAKSKKSEEEVKQIFNNEKIVEGCSVKTEQIVSSKRQQDKPLKDPQQQINQKKDQIQHCKDAVKVKFTDLIVIQHLRNTLKQYQSDLSVFQQNKENLMQQIKFLSRKISKFGQIKKENLDLEDELSTLKKALTQEVKSYHKVKQERLNLRFRTQAEFQRYKLKLREQLFCEKENSSDCLLDDTIEIAELECWESYVNFKTASIRAMNYHIQNKVLERDQSQMMKRILGNNAGLYTKAGKKPFDGELANDSIANKEQKKNQDMKLKKQISSPFDEELEAYLKPEKPKMSKDEKNSIVGDLKKFAQSFKLPK